MPHLGPSVSFTRVSNQLGLSRDEDVLGPWKCSDKSGLDTQTPHDSRSESPTWHLYGSILFPTLGPQCPHHAQCYHTSHARLHRPPRGTQASVRTQQPVPLRSPPCLLPAKLIDVLDVGKQCAHLLHVQPQGLAIHQRAQVVLWG